jgi:PleD family two-component response regulator
VCAFRKGFFKAGWNAVAGPVWRGYARRRDSRVLSSTFLRTSRLRRKLNHLAYHDALTDLPNQVLFKDRLKQAIALSRRNDQMQAVLLLNLDRFKTINDSLGYTAGDRPVAVSGPTADELCARKRYCRAFWW